MNLSERSRQILLLISGPAGSGKTTLCNRMMEAYPQIERVVTSTTRAPRRGEQHGVDYYFFERSEFLKKVENGEFLEYAEVHGNLYGCLREEVIRKLQSGHDVLLNIDIQGAASIRTQSREDPTLKDALVTVFLTPSNTDELRQRLLSRTESDNHDLEVRLARASEEVAEERYYDFLILSSTREADFDRLAAIFHHEKLRDPEARFRG